MAERGGTFQASELLSGCVFIFHCSVPFLKSFVVCKTQLEPRRPPQRSRVHDGPRMLSEPHRWPGASPARDLERLEIRRRTHWRCGPAVAAAAVHDGFPSNMDRSIGMLPEVVNVTFRQFIAGPRQRRVRHQERCAMRSPASLGSRSMPRFRSNQSGRIALRSLRAGSGFSETSR